MINIDIAVPIINKVYDFSIDENTAVETITEDIVDLIIQKEAYTSVNTVDMLLFFEKNQVVLDPGKSLRINGVSNGDRLLLV